MKTDSLGSELKALLVSVPIREQDGSCNPTAVGLQDGPSAEVLDCWQLRDRAQSLTSWDPLSSPFKCRVIRVKT